MSEDLTQKIALIILLAALISFFIFMFILNRKINKK